MPTSFSKSSITILTLRASGTHTYAAPHKMGTTISSHNLDIHCSVDVLNLWHLHSIDDISSSISRQLDQGHRILTRIVSSTRSTLTSFLHGSDFFATHVLPPRKRLVSTHVLPPRKRLVSHNIVCHRQDTFLVSHGIIPESLLHLNRHMSSIPRLSGQNSDFHGTLLQHIFVT